MSTAFHGKWLFCMLIDYWLIYRSDEPAPAALEAPGTAVSGHITGEDSSTELPSTHDRDAVYPHWYVRGAVYLVAFLHTRHHVTFRACTLILKCLEHVFTSLPGNLLRGTADMPTTLHTVFARLKARDRFTIHPVCYNCHKVFQPGIASNTFCPDCNLELFRPAPRRLFNALDDGQATVPAPGDGEEVGDARREPHMVAPIQSLSVALAEFFARPGMVASVNAWKTRTTVEGELRSMQDGELWRTLRGHDGELFFFGPSAAEELRLGVTFSLDW